MSTPVIVPVVPLPRTLKEKAEALSLATTARQHAEAAELECIKAMVTSSGPGDEAVTEGDAVVDLASGVVYGATGGNLARFPIRQVVSTTSV